ncbi:MAG: hypothetical protein JW839_04140 [Candidatus Lokiarchaeota archaeon]|nr:hypothetical protein [Candidatus Lokiarchaeota archaeon]
MSQHISTGIMVTRESLRTLVTPPEALRQFTAEAGSYLVIFNPRPDNMKISIIPCKTREVLKIVVHLTEFSPQTVKNIADIIYDLKISTVHTSGICFHEKECCYEAYVEAQGGEIAGPIKERFSKVPQFKAVDLEIIKVS